VVTSVPMPMTDIPEPTVTQVVEPPTAKRIEWGVLALSGVMAVVLTATFIGPLQRMSVPKGSRGVVAGARDSQPLTVTVQLTNGKQRQDLSVQPEHGLLIEVLAKAANLAHGQFVYAIRGQGAYLTYFLDHANDASGRWVITKNGLEVTDIWNKDVAQSDIVTATWQPAQ